MVTELGALSLFVLLVATVTFREAPNAPFRLKVAARFGFEAFSGICDAEMVSDNAEGTCRVLVEKAVLLVSFASSTAFCTSAEITKNRSPERPVVGMVTDCVRESEPPAAMSVVNKMEVRN